MSTEAVDATGTCWFCKRETWYSRLIAGYDTWDEQRLACPSCDGAIKWLTRHGCFVSRTETVAAVLRELREEVADPSEWLSTCRCFVINPKFGEGQPGGHFTDCAWAQESDVRDEILAAIDRRLAP